jgi:hypothetical protein
MKPQTQLARLVAEVARRGALMDEVSSPAERLASRLPYPRLFSGLLAHHSFVGFDVGAVRIASNIKGEEENLEDLLADEALTHALVDAGFLPFGRLATGNYDRVCFDMRGGKNPLDAPIVRMNHEAILSHNRIPRPEQLASGIMHLLVEPGSCTERRDSVSVKCRTSRARRQ